MKLYPESAGLQLEFDKIKSLLTEKCRTEFAKDKASSLRIHTKKEFIDLQLKRYRGWQKEASKSFDDIPRRFRIPLQTAVEMYNWTADKIDKDPYIIFKKKLKPRKARVLVHGLRKKLKRK